MIQVELCAASIQAVKVAKEMDFDRIELCQTLEQGGITPSPGMIEYALAYGLDVHVLIRPRPGGFIYTQEEIELILREVREAKTIGAHGVVVGVLNQRGLICESSLDLIMQHAGGMDVTFHRAFDDTFDPEQSLDVLMKQGVKRLLSSGMASNAELGLPILQNMKRYVGDRLEIMPGGGINLSNVEQIIRDVNPDAIHFSGTRKFDLDENSLFSETVLKIDRSKTEKLLNAIRGVH
jgi:copper homeostasis protein